MNQKANDSTDNTSAYSNTIVCHQFYFTSPRSISSTNTGSAYVIPRDVVTLQSTKISRPLLHSQYHSTLFIYRKGSSLENRFG
ncbi:MAG: hypothetical protein KDD53_11440, partial [Bdellovibrionales bacterium]|nr:hypothetical protein [Bdellovibrionales bacterium]